MIVYQALAREKIIKKNWHVSEFELDTTGLKACLHLLCKDLNNLAELGTIHESCTTQYMNHT